MERFKSAVNSFLSIIQANEELSILLDKYDWFHCSEIEGRSIVVYVEFMNKNVLEIVPMNLYGHNIKIAYAQYLHCDEKYGKGNVISLYNEPSVGELRGSIDLED